MSKEIKEIILIVLAVILIIATFSGALYLGLAIHTSNQDLAISQINTKGVNNGNFQN